MDPPPDSTPKPPAADTGTLVIEEIAPEQDPESPRLKSASKRPNQAQLLALSLLMLALVGVATWWVVSRPTAPVAAPSSPSDLPHGLVALINSSTPIPLQLPTGAKESAHSLSDPPDQDAWTQPIREAHRALEEGRYTSAISQYSALAGSGSAQEAHDALWGLAEAYSTSGQRDLAIRAYTIFVGLGDPRAPSALYRIALLHEQAGRTAEAADLYGKYSTLGIATRHAALLSQARLLGRTQQAEAIYNVILGENPLDIDLRAALQGLAETRSSLGNHKGAAEVYQQLATLQATHPRPLIDQENIPAAVRVADEIAQSNDKAGARKRLLDYIKDPCAAKSAPCPSYPLGRYHALTSLLKVDPSAIVSSTISPLLAGRISYDAGYYGDAISHLNTLRAISQDLPDRAAASLITGKAYELSGDSTSAFNWYTATVQTYPASLEAPEAARKAGDMLEEQTAWDAAMSVYRDALQRYPNAGRETVLTRTHAGVLAYRLGAPDEALDLLRPASLMLDLTPSVRAEATFWLAKVQKSKGDPQWKATIASVSTLVPGTFLYFRTRSLLAGEPDGGPLTPTFTESAIAASTLGNQFSNEAQERQQLLAWAAKLSPTPQIATTTPIITPTITPKITATTIRASTPLTPTHIPTSPTTNSNGPSSVVRRPSSIDQSEITRALTLVHLGDARATIALGELAQSMRDAGDAHALAELVLYARYHADTRTAMRVAETLAALDATGDPLKRPRLLLKTLFPTPYGLLVAQEAEIRKVDPLVMYALMRQESQFVPGARSRSDARGLTQVIPSTGEGIAAQLGDPAYSTDDLFLPHVSLRYGTYYFASNLPQFDNKLLPTFAAYNGGPGNAARWLAGSALIDPDLFAERIDLFETEDYLGKVYTNYGFYKLAYSP
jgi:soluble lytic murein transglycosylase